MLKIRRLCISCGCVIGCKSEKVIRHCYLNDCGTPNCYYTKTKTPMRGDSHGICPSCYEEKCLQGAGIA
jgi:hypothetical protein